MPARGTALQAMLLLCLLTAPASAALYPQNPWRDGDSIYVSRQGVYRFDMNTADPLWTSLQGVEIFAPVAYRDLLLVGSTQGLYALRSSDGSVAWHIEKQHTLFTPTLAGRAYAGSVHGELYAIALIDGAIALAQKLDGWIYSPAIGDQAKRLWTGGQQHAIYSLASHDGKLLRELATSQESVFGAVDLGAGQAAFNLFDGSTVVVGIDSQQIDAILGGDSPPTAVKTLGDQLYRSHSDGSLSAFARASLKFSWRLALAAQDLVMHPSLPDYLLFGDRNRKLFLLDPAQDNQACELEADAEWLLPIQVEAGKMVSFRKSMQPPGLRLVKSPATCI